MSFSQRMLRGQYTKRNFESEFQKELTMIVTALSLSPNVSAKTITPTKLK